MITWYVVGTVENKLESLNTKTYVRKSTVTEITLIFLNRYLNYSTIPALRNSISRIILM